MNYDKMTKEEFYILIKQWSNETGFLSYHATDHPAYVKALQAGEDVIPWSLERLKDSIGHDSGDDMDQNNSPWFTICLLSDLSNHECLANFPEEYAGMLDKLREYILKWGEVKGLIKLI